MKRPPLAMNVLHGLLWQSAWFAVVLGAAHGLAWAAPLAALPALALHAWHFRHAPAWGLAVPAAAAVLGLALDSLLGMSGLLLMAGDGGWSALATPWMVALWALQGSGLRFSSAWLIGRPRLGAFFGLVGGPLAYWGGGRLGAIDWPGGLAAGLLAVGLAWAVAIAVLLLLAEHEDRPQGEVSHA